MKFLIICCFSLVAQSFSHTDEKVHEMVKALLAECQKDEGGSASDFDLLLSGKYPDTHEGHCMITCVNEKVGIVRNHFIVAAISLNFDISLKVENPTRMDF